MTSSEFSRSTLLQTPERRVELMRQLVESVVTLTELSEVVRLGVGRIEEVASGCVAGLSEDEYRVVVQ